MGLINEILNYVRGTGETDTAEGVETALQRVATERSAANNALTSGAGRRRELLLQDGSDKAIAGLDRELDGHRLVLERLELIEGELFDRLQALRSVERQAAWRKFAKKYEIAAVNHANAIRTAVKSLTDVCAAIDAAREAGFDAEVTAAFSPPLQHLLMTPETIVAFEDGIERLRDAVSGRLPKAAPDTSRPRPTVKPQTPRSFQRAVRLGENPAPPPMKPRELFRDQAKPGEVLVSVMKAGYEAPDGRQCTVGDQISVPVKIAEQAVRNSAVVYADEGVAA
jgi:hypothetical protein